MDLIQIYLQNSHNMSGSKLYQHTSLTFTAPLITGLFFPTVNRSGRLNT